MPRRPRTSLIPYTWRALLWAERGGTPSKVAEVWVETSLDDDWTAAFRLFERDGEVGVAELRVFPHENDRATPGRWSAETKRLGLDAPVPGIGLTARTLRRVRFDAVRTYTRKAIGEVRSHRGEDDFVIRHFRIFGAGATVQRGSGRAWTDEAYARLAANYVRLVEQGHSSPVAELATSENYSESRIRHALREARDRGLLSPTVRRRAGGTLTPKALALLGVHDG